MQQYVKKTQCVTVRAFMARMGLLNDYLAHLPTVKDSPMAVEDTKKSNVPFDKADLAGIVLKAISTSWVNQYNLTHLMLQKSPRLLLPDLENIKRVMNKKCMESAKARARTVQPWLARSPALRTGSLWAQASKSPRKLASPSSASTARTTAGPTRLTTPRNAASTTRTEKLLQPLPRNPMRRSPIRSMGVEMTSRWLI